MLFMQLKHYVANPSQKLIAADATPAMLLEEQERIQLSNEEQLNSVLNKAHSQSGPVHLNVPLEEPLYGTTTSEIIFQKITSSSPPDESALGNQLLMYGILLPKKSF